jgi:hypothetical protein
MRISICFVQALLLLEFVIGVKYGEGNRFQTVIWHPDILNSGGEGILFCALQCFHVNFMTPRDR